MSRLARGIGSGVLLGLALMFASFLLLFIAAVYEPAQELLRGAVTMFTWPLLAVLRHVPQHPLLGLLLWCLYWLVVGEVLYWTGLGIRHFWPSSGRTAGGRGFPVE
jgi:hypothetical protein